MKMQQDGEQSDRKGKKERKRKDTEKEKCEK